MATWSAGDRITADKLTTYAGEPEIREINSVSFTTTETEIDTITVPVVEGRRYKIVWRPAFFSTVANDHVRGAIREDNVAGTALYVQNITTPIVSQAFMMDLEAFYTAVTTGDKTFVGTGDRITGSGGTITGQAASSNPTLLYVENA